MGKQQLRLEDLDIQINWLTQAVPQALQTYQPPALLTAPLVSRPDKFAGEASQCTGFLLQCSLYFTGLVSINDQQKIAQFLSLPTSKANKWATAVWGKRQRIPLLLLPLHCHVPPSFWSCPQRKGNWKTALAIKQGKRRAAEYALEFHIIASGSEWNELALKVEFQQGLNTEVLTELACHDKQMTLNSLIDLATSLDNLIQNHCNYLKSATPPSPVDTPEPMQITRAKVDLA